MRKALFKIFFLLLGLGGKKVEKEKKGTIIIMIDGLSFDALHIAMEKGYCPTLKKMSKERYFLHQYYCGLPAATTATEALLFYGNNYNIPGFTWYDRQLQKFVRGNRSQELEKFEDIFEKKRRLFVNGSVIMGVYSGGATELSLSGRNLAFSKSLHFLKTAHYFLVALLYPIQLIRTVYLTTKTLLFYRGSNHLSVKDTLSKIVLGQFSCFLTEIEIIRNTKNIFVDFLLYDEFAHEHGPTHKTTLSTLRLLDRYIKRIIHTASHADRSYEFILLSDHGQTESIEIDNVKQYINRALHNESYQVIETYGGISPKKTENELYIVPAGSTLQCYFSHTLDTGLVENEITAQFPGMISRLLAQEEFGWVLLKKNKNSAVLHGKSGSVTLNSDGSHRIEGNPFPAIEHFEVNKILASLHYYSTFPNNGDIVLFGSITNHNKIYCFEKHKGTHGGFFGPMTHPFIMSDNPKISGDSMPALFDTIAIDL